MTSNEMWRAHLDRFAPGRAPLELRRVVLRSFGPRLAGKSASAPGEVVVEQCRAVTITDAHNIIGTGVVWVRGEEGGTSWRVDVEKLDNIDIDLSDYPQLWAVERILACPGLLKLMLRNSDGRTLQELFDLVGCRCRTESGEWATITHFTGPSQREDEDEEYVEPCFEVKFDGPYIAHCRLSSLSGIGES